MFRYLSLSMLVVVLFACTRQEVKVEQVLTPFLHAEATWADSMVFSMSIDEKIGQLLLYQPQVTDSLQKDSLIRLVVEQRLGGMLLEDMELSGYLDLVDTLQRLSRVPLFNASRQPLSLHNQFSDLIHLPSAATISATGNDTLKTLMETYHLDQLDYLGINLRLDITPKVPEHTFNFNLGTYDQTEVLEQATDQLSQAQDLGILSVAGDFGDLYYLENDTTGVIDSILHPYHHLVQRGISGVKVAPQIFQIDTLLALPPHFLKRYLVEHTDFKGLLFADWKSESFQNIAYTGVDVFIVKDSFENRFNTIRKLVNEGVFTQTDLNEKVRKILLAKSWMGLDTIQPKLDHTLAIDLMNEGFDDFEIRQMYETGMTLVQNPEGLIPFKDTYKRPFRIIQFGKEELWDFQNYFSKYAAFSTSNIKQDSNGRWEALDVHRFRRSKLVLTLNQLTLDQEKDTAFIRSINALGQKTDVVVVNFGDPRGLIHFDSTIAIVQHFERTALTESLAAQLLFGGLQAQGQLPLALGQRFPKGHGIDTTAITRVKYTVPEEVGISAYKLVGIDAIARNAIQEGATPGCQVLVAKDGKIIYSKSFGRHEFRKGKLVQASDLYDLASLTKIASTTIGMMKLYDEKKIKINDRLHKHIDLGKKSKLKNIRIRELLTHQSGLQPNMPIASYILYQDTTGTGCSGPFCKEKKLTYSVPIADSFYMDINYQDTIWQEVYDLKPRRSKRYRYSDVNFNLLMKVIENEKETGLDDYIKKTFYDPMNLNHLTYNPLQRFQKRDIVPTAKEERFRNQLIHGHVHDESAALLGGVGGNAGLFGNAESLAPLFQMLLNKGAYGGKQYLSPETIALFTKQQRGTKRGLGFDVNTKSGTRVCSNQASAKTFGHTGFTGTCVWVDPETDLIFIFLSNRIYPDVSNRKLFRKKVRTRMHNLVYDALNSYPEKEIETPVERPVILEANVSIEE